MFGPDKVLAGVGGLKPSVYADLNVKIDKNGRTNVRNQSFYRSFGCWIGD